MLEQPQNVGEKKKMATIFFLSKIDPQKRFLKKACFPFH